MSPRRPSSWRWLALLPALHACAADGGGGGHEPRPDPPRVAATTSAPRAMPPARSTLEPGALRSVEAAPVVGFTGPGGAPFELTLRTKRPASANARRFGTVAMRTSLRARAANVTQYPCTSCHLGRSLVLADERMRDAHGDIRPTHPARTGATCGTCHAAEDVELLTLKSGDRATLDHAYRLCAQCHFAQADAWAGGAHGKRLDGWQGRRVVMGCADCHDPHGPSIEQRTPFRAPRLQRARSATP